MKLLVVTAAFGTGHNQVAEAVAQAATQEGHSAVVVDGLAISLPRISTVLTRGFIGLLKAAPWLYRMAYNRSEEPGPFDGVKAGGMRTLTRLMMPRLSALLAEVQPDAIVATHPFMLGVLGHLRMQGRIPAPVVGVLTDFAAHGFWLHRGVDAYCVATDEMGMAMRRYGVAPHRIFTTGIPIRQLFRNPPDRQTATGRLGLEQERPTVLMMGGGLGLGPMRELAEKACRARLPLQVLVVTGHNRSLYDQLLPLVGQPAGRGTSLHLYAYVPHVHELMAASDLLVSKPGAVTASEALAMSLPMLSVQPIPGHEERNQAVLVAAGAAGALPPHVDIAGELERLLGRPEQLQAMHRAARRIGRPNAAGHVIARIAGLVRGSRAITA